MGKRKRTRRPQLQLEVGGLGMVDPFQLEVVENPPGSEGLFVAPRGVPAPRYPLELAGLNLVGAAQALLTLSYSWARGGPVAGGTEGGEDEDRDDPPTSGEARLGLRRRDARLLASLLRRHLNRLPEPTPWMKGLLTSLEQIDDFLQWEVP